MTFFNIKELHFRYDEDWILENLSFEGNKGDLIALVGPSGCGKTTLLRILVGILLPQRGSVFLDQVDVLQTPMEKRKIGYVPQNQALFPHLSVYENISFGLHAHKWKNEDIKRRVNELAIQGELKNLLQRRPHELSGGQQQRVALLRALAPFPKLLLLDEPLSNIDAQLREQLAIYIREIQQKASITTLFVTHDLNEAKMLADKLILLKEGKILQIGTPTDLSLNPKSMEIAQTLGYKNIYKIFSIHESKEHNRIQIVTEIGNFSIHESLLTGSNNKPKGMFINPSEVQISNEQGVSPNILKGTIIAMIPNPMLNQSTVLINVETNNINQKHESQDTDQQVNKILRVQIPIEQSQFQISEQVSVMIPDSAFKVHY